MNVYIEALLPVLRRWVLERRSAEWIRRKCGSMVRAMGVTRAMRGYLRAIKDVLDRYEGTAIRRNESKNQYSKMSKPELAALAHQKLKDAGIL